MAPLIISVRAGILSFLMFCHWAISSVVIQKLYCMEYCITTEQRWTCYIILLNVIFILVMSLRDTTPIWQIYNEEVKEGIVVVLFFCCCFYSTHYSYLPRPGSKMTHNNRFLAVQPEHVLLITANIMLGASNGGPVKTQETRLTCVDYPAVITWGGGGYLLERTDVNVDGYNKKMYLLSRWVKKKKNEENMCWHCSMCTVMYC